MRERDEAESGKIRKIRVEKGEMVVTVKASHFHPAPRQKCLPA